MTRKMAWNRRALNSALVLGASNREITVIFFMLNLKSMLLNLLPYLPRTNELITQPTCHVAWYFAISYDITSRCLPGLHSLPAYSMFDFYVSLFHLCSTHNDCKIGIIGFFWIRQVVIRAGVFYSHLWSQLVITVRRQPTLQKTVV